MFKIIKNSLVIVKNNSILPFTFVVFMITVSLLLQNVTFKNAIFAVVYLSLILLLNAGFLSGWFGMVKKSIENSYTDFNSEEDKFKAILDVRKEFLSSVAPYILPILAIIILGYILLLGALACVYKFAKHFIGTIHVPVDILRQTTASLNNYIATLPKEDIILMSKWFVCFMGAYLLFFLFTMFVIPALFYEKNNSKNPLRAFLNSFVTLFKKPVQTLSVFFFVLFLFMALQILGVFTGGNSILDFIYLVINIYTIVFILVLIFNCYEQYFTDNGNNGSDSIRQNKDGDTFIKENQC